MTTRALPFLALASLALPAALFAAAADDVKIAQSDDKVRIELGGQLFTEYIFKGTPRPYLYPILAADGTKLNRDFPMVKDAPGEEYDHPHHRSLWFTHGAVNGVDFWLDGATKGKIVNESVRSNVRNHTANIESRNRWLAPDGAVVCIDETTIRARAVPGGRLLDYEVTLKAQPDKPLVFGDTKEGSMAIRLAQWLTAPHQVRGSDGVRRPGTTKGVIVNDSGARDMAGTWGKKSTWVDYHAEKDGKTYGVAMFDHPKNPRHPTWWHVRDYGLFAANPFGQRDFEGTREKPLPPGTGNLTVPAGGSVTFRWRFYFHQGDEKAGKVAEQYKEYAAGK